MNQFTTDQRRALSQKKKKKKLLLMGKAIMYGYLSSFSFIICSVALAINVDIHLFTASIIIQ